MFSDDIEKPSEYVPNGNPETGTLMCLDTNQIIPSENQAEFPFLADAKTFQFNPGFVGAQFQENSALGQNNYDYTSAGAQFQENSLSGQNNRGLIKEVPFDTRNPTTRASDNTGDQLRCQVTERDTQSNNFESKLLAFLREDAAGKLVFAHFDIHKSLNKASRGILTRTLIGKLKSDALVDYVVGQQIDKFQISDAVFLKIAEIIEKIFPGESAITYFSPYRVENGSVFQKCGTLWAHYNYVKDDLRKKGVLKPSTSKLVTIRNTNLYQSPPAEDSLKTALNNLQNSLNDSTLVADWKTTYNHRSALLTVDKILISDYLNLFPCLRTESAKELFTEDFNYLHPQKSDLLHKRWPCLKKVLISQLQSLEKQTPNKANKFSIDDRILIRNLLKLKEDKQDAVVLYLLQTLIGVGSVGRKRKSDSAVENRKYTQQEIRDSFFYQINLTSDLESEIQTARDKIQARKETLQPFICFVGNDVENIEEVFVILDDQQYKVSTCLDGVDLAFKIFYALDCAYPKPSLRLWQFLQQAIYDINLAEQNIKSVKELLGLTHQAFKEVNSVSTSTNLP